MLSWIQRITVAGRQARCAGPVNSPGAEASHGVDQATWTVSYPSLLSPFSQLSAPVPSVLQNPSPSAPLMNTTSPRTGPVAGAMARVPVASCSRSGQATVNA